MRILVGEFAEAEAAAFSNLDGSRKSLRVMAE
jgi:hypothetical protein